MRKFFIVGLFLSPLVFQSQIDSINVLKPAAVSAVTSDDRSPFAHTNLDSEALNTRDSGQDLPFLLRLTPSVVITSDAGNGIGYTGMRLRGSDASRINVTINGVPLNDAESQNVYWVDLPDLGASVSGLQIQRGVGTSTVGPGAFGGSVALNTLGDIVQPHVKAVLGMGSFNSYRQSVSWNTGMLGNGMSFDGRASHISSDGYIDRASSELSSLYTSLVKRWTSGKVSLTTMLGHERTYQAWYGVPQIATEENTTDTDIQDWASGSYEYGYGTDTQRISDLIENRRTHNYYNYENEVDDYTQNHFQLHFEQNIGIADLGVALYTTSGSGFYEQFRAADSFSNYGLVAPISPDSSAPETTNVIRQRWLDNRLWGSIVNLTIPLEDMTIVAGGAYSMYKGDHFGEIVWMEHAADILPGTNYYDNIGNKTDVSGFVRVKCDLMDDIIRLQAEAQVRSVLYTASGLDNDLREVFINDDKLFFNPKIGVDYILSPSSRGYASVAIANREPTRSDYLDSPFWGAASIRHERLMDFEFGYRYVAKKWATEIGFYHMDYKDQLIATGMLNDVGNSVRVNVPSSFRQGIEFQAGVELQPRFRWDGNVTVSRNKINVFSEILYDYNPDFDYVNPVNHVNTDISFSPGFIAASVFGYDVWSNDEIQIECELSTKYVGKQYLDNTSNDSRSLPGYVLNNVVLSFSQSFKSGGDLKLSVFANNILDNMYSANGWTYSYLNGGMNAMTTENYVYPQAGRHGFVNLTMTF
ncbi:MAG: TonB-dependent receptor plug domain-containing protein [Flavobacteriales bacterium]|nr:TonB-dependent receptor plug domain-containing protein [Flavobacteriales bacterium]